jgi:PleD family two-component response regulator
MHGIVTVSIGVAWTEATLDRSPQDTVQVADEALYAAKLEGRNRTIYQGADEAHTFTATLRRAPLLRPVR